MLLIKAQVLRWLVVVHGQKGPTPRRPYLCGVILVSLVLVISLMSETSFARVRKSVTSMTTQEKQDFVDALLALKAVDPGAMTLDLDGYDDFVKVHYDHFSAGGGHTIHQGPSFLAWHREYLRRLEDLLRSVNGNAYPNVTIPYWDWTTDPFPSDLQVVGDSNFLGAKLSGPVTTGPFQTPAWTVRIPNPGNPRALTRQFQAFSLPSGADVTTALGIQVFDSPPWNRFTQSTMSFRNTLEGFVPNVGLHNLVHGWVGGDMNAPESPNDPTFWLHHANIDRLWCQWQEMHSFNFHHLPLGGTHDPLGRPGPAPNGHNVYDDLDYFTDTMPYDTLNPIAMGIEYDDCVGPCETSPGVTSSQFMIATAT